MTWSVIKMFAICPEGIIFFANSLRRFRNWKQQRRFVWQVKSAVQHWRIAMPAKLVSFLSTSLIPLCFFFFKKNCFLEGSRYWLQIPCGIICPHTILLQWITSLMTNKNAFSGVVHQKRGIDTGRGHTGRGGKRGVVGEKGWRPGWSPAGTTAETTQPLHSDHPQESWVNPRWQYKGQVGENRQEESWVEPPKMEKKRLLCQITPRTRKPATWPQELQGGGLH